ncbi:SRPBCC family protein [Pseudonocardia sp. TRM90224]|uniref:SRPBCC family protein n=1 Tax=Pseudonocardia sp. TRM90224 TaxID=2812678 RepID=UPI001E5ABB6B|nr:SRPBCC domain-containing protein [Pseudonocardia sp. TRM90224]
MSRKFEVRREVVLPAAPEQVWQAIATPEGQAAWFMSLDDESADTLVKAATEGEGRRLEITAGTHAFEYIVEAGSGATTVLRFVHSGVLDDEWGDEYESMTGHGWDLYLFTLGEYLKHFPGRSSVYGSAEAPPGRDVWVKLLDTLGDPAVGETVRLPIGAGVVDLRNDHYLGIRTGNALVRFHERSKLGMPLAVGHHDYGPGADPEQIGATWSGWLATTANHTSRDN